MEGVRRVRGRTHLRTGDAGQPGAVLQADVGAVLPDGDHVLRAATRRLGQTPFAAGRPLARVGHGRVDRVAHDRHRLDGRVERPVPRQVDGHRQVDQRHGAEHERQLAHAYQAANVPVLFRYGLRRRFVFLLSAATAAAFVLGRHSLPVST